MCFDQIANSNLQGYICVTKNSVGLECVTHNSCGN
jgi:hypothetical protein